MFKFHSDWRRITDLKTFVQRRSFERKPANVNISFFYGGMFYSGLVTNVSQRGMFIRTMVNLPEGRLFPLIIRREAEVLSMLARVRHHKKTDYLNTGIGVDIISPPACFQSKWFDQK